MKTWSILIFNIANFVALAIGGFFTGDGVPSDWYQELNKAPWTPPGWVFGAAWTFIMVCFGLFMGTAWHLVQNKKKLILLYSVHWVLNVSWNPIFFSAQMVLFGLIVITLLWALMLYFTRNYYKETKWKVALIFPYVIWLTIATSLNAYIYIYN